MKQFAAIALVIFSSFAFGSDFDAVRKAVQHHMHEKHDIKLGAEDEVHFPSYTTPAKNTSPYSLIADISIRITRKKESQTYRLQLAKIDNSWIIQRELSSNQLLPANPLIVNEYVNEEWREHAKLNKIISELLEDRLRKAGKIEDVKEATAYCYSSVKHGRALCSSQYIVWGKEEPECESKAILFEKKGNVWTKVDGNYHDGMRLTDDGKIYEMLPRSVCEGI